MDKARILRGLLWIAQETGGIGPATLDQYLGELRRAGYIEIELREQGGGQLPCWIPTEKGRAKL